MLIFIIILIYFLPTISAFERKKKNTSSIFVVNFFLGWTLIGWVVALSWALSKDDKHVVTVEKKDTSGEIAELFELKEKGVITEEEFKQQKQKILS
jgi:uncharacterized membrane protein